MSLPRRVGPEWLDHCRRMTRVPSVRVATLRRLTGGCDTVERSASFARAPLHCVVIRPLLVATTQRSPQRTIESIVPTPGTVSPRTTSQMPLGPTKTALPSTTSRTVQPSIVVGLVSGTALGLDEIFPGCWAPIPANFGGVLCCCSTDEIRSVNVVDG